MMRRLWYAQTISVFGDFLALFAVISVLTFRMHANPQQITTVQIAYLPPIAILGVLAGVFVDRWPIKLTMVSSDAIRAGLVLLLMVATELWQFYAILARSAWFQVSLVRRRGWRFVRPSRFMACARPMRSSSR